jgi:hypothetical protein
MNSYQLASSQRYEADRLASASFEALTKKDYQLARDLKQQQIKEETDYAKSIANEYGYAPDISKIEAAFTELSAITEKQKDGAQSAADEQAANYDKLAKEVVTLKEKLQALAGESVKIDVEVDKTALQGMIDEITKAVRSIQANVQVQVSQVQSYATGGYVSGEGTGTSDSIMSRISNGEYVVKAETVRNVGVGFMNSLNNGSLAVNAMPAFANGGIMGTVSGAAVHSGGQSETVNLSIDLGGGDTALLSGSRDQVQNFVSAFKKASKGSL